MAETVDEKASCETCGEEEFRVTGHYEKFTDQLLEIELECTNCLTIQRIIPEAY